MTCVLQPVYCFTTGKEINRSQSETNDERLTDLRKSVGSLPDARLSKMLGSGVFPEILPKKHERSAANESTAIVALQKAIQMKELQKSDKARKLFRHALSLCPSHPDVLSSYGEFLEEVETDIINADYFYEKAVLVCPQHPKAIANIKRTRHLVDEIDEKLLSLINEKRILLNSIPSNELLKEIEKENYFQHVHNTVAIEGNTMTLTETRAFIETGVPIPGKSRFEHNEILGVVDALQFVKDSLLNKVEYITVDDILSLHKRILRRVDSVQAGSFRETQVYVGVHTPPAASDVHNLMQDLCKWLNSKQTEIHPVKLAALAHHKVAFIHPFSDGNGRTARLCMNFILMRAGYPAIVIRKQDNTLYFNSLQIANEGDVRPFVRFVAQNTVETLDVYYHAAQVGLSEIFQTLKL